MVLASDPHSTFHDKSRPDTNMDSNFFSPALQKLWLWTCRTIKALIKVFFFTVVTVHSWHSVCTPQYVVTLGSVCISNRSLADHLAANVESIQFDAGLAINGGLVRGLWYKATPVLQSGVQNLISAAGLLLLSTSTKHGKGKTGIYTTAISVWRRLLTSPCRQAPEKQLCGRNT